MSRRASRWNPPGHGDALPLPAGQLVTVFEPAVEQGAVAVGQLGDDLVGTGDRGGGVEGGLALVGAHRDVVAGGERPAGVVLRDDGGAQAQLVGADLAQVGVVPADGAAVGLVETGEDLGQGGLAGAVLTCQEDELTGPDLQVDLTEQDPPRLTSAPGLPAGDGTLFQPEEHLTAPGSLRSKVP